MASTGGSDGAFKSERSSSSSSSRSSSSFTSRDSSSSMGSNVSTEPTSLTIRVLQEITENFSEERALGQGAYGKVYKGVHGNGEEVAVKLLHNNMLATNDEQFQHEFDNLIKLNHPNIVRLVGYCYETQRQHTDYQGRIVFAETTYRALCLEYMHMGSLQRHLSDESHGLDWKTRYKIIKGTCEGLKYLHEGFNQPIYHLDLKPDNILLDENMTPKLADFGLSKHFCEELTRVTHSPAGTIGYMPPEYLFHHVVSKKLDIFSLGVVITKIIAGPKGHTRSAEMPYQEFMDEVHGNWRNRLEATCTSTRMLEAYCKQLSICAEIGLSSMEDDRHERPTILDIIDKLDATEAMIEKVNPLSENSRSSVPAKSQRKKDDNLVELEAFARNKAIHVTETCNKFPILVRVTGVPWRRAEDTGVDLVLAHNVPNFMGYVLMKLVDKLSPNDRLSILFCGSGGIEHVMELTYMSEHGRDVAKKLAQSHVCEEAIYGGPVLSEAAQVLRQRGLEESTRRTGCIMHFWASESRMQPEIHKQDISQEFPVHTIAMGEHDPGVMREIADMTSGTYFSITDENADTNAGVALLDSILSVAPRSVRITLQADEGVTISSMESGRYSNLVSRNTQSATVDLGDINPGEQKTFIVYLTVPQGKEKLVTIGGRYQSRNTSEELVGMDVAVLRPHGKCLPDEVVIHPKVAAELLRIRLMEGIAKWNQDLGRNNLRLLLDKIKNSDEGRTAPEEILSELEEEVAEMTDRYGVDRESMLSSLNCHQLQRSTCKGTPRNRDAFQILKQQREDEQTNLVNIKAFPRSKAIMCWVSYDEFAVIVRVTVPPWRHGWEMPRDGVDVVAVLDISRNIQGERLELVKQAMMIVIDKLGPDDRLSIVTFQTRNRCLMELTYMSNVGRDAARLKITHLKASSVRYKSGIAKDALDEGYEILRRRELGTRLGCMMLLSEGKYPERLHDVINHTYKVHTFGLGSDHDPRVMKGIADSTGGTYSFVDQEISNLKDALALFITGLTSIAVRSMLITLRAEDDTSISSIESGNCSHKLMNRNKYGEINIEEMYAGEQKDFIVYLTVNVETDDLMTIGDSPRLEYRGDSHVKVFVSVKRPWLALGDLANHPDVAAEVTRNRLAKSIVYMLDTNQFTNKELQERWEIIKYTAEGYYTREETLSRLSLEVAEMSRGSGMPYMLSWLSCNIRQRATTKGTPKNSSAFRTIGQYADEDTNLVKVVTFTRSKALRSDDQCNKFPVLVRVMAAPQRQAGEMPHAGVDVVAVLDASAGMQGEKLVRMKMAMMVIIGKLRPEDRLSIVSFNTYENRLTRLTFMTDHGRDVARLKISNLVASGQGDFAAALREGAEILWWREAESSRRVGCIVFLSDSKNYEIFETAIRPEFPVHTFGLGTDHNPSMMKYIADITSGTYSYVYQDTGMIQDALSKFITGLTSVAAMSIKITLRTNKGITISSIESGGYVNHVRNKQFGTIHIDNIYAGERKDFIVYLRVAEGKKDLMTIGGRYLSYDTVKHLAYTDVYVQRPHQEILPDDLAIQPELAAELVRIRLEKGISTKLEKGLSIAELQQLWEETMETDEGRGAPAETLSALSMDVAEMKRDIENPSEYRKSGLPYTLSWLTSRKWQRATIKGTPFSSGAIQITGQDTDGRETPSQRDSICRLPFCCGFLYEVVCSYFQR